MQHFSWATHSPLPPRLCPEKLIPFIVIYVEVMKPQWNSHNGVKYEASRCEKEPIQQAALSLCSNPHFQIRLVPKSFSAELMETHASTIFNS